MSRNVLTWSQVKTISGINPSDPTSLSFQQDFPHYAGNIHFQNVDFFFLMLPTGLDVIL